MMDIVELKEILVAIEQARVPIWIPIVSTIATVALAIIAVLALCFAARQVGGTSRQAEAAIEANQSLSAQARVSTILQFDQMWESNDFAGSRAEIQKFRGEVETEVYSREDHQHLSEQKKISAFREECSRRLYRMRDENRERYLKILKLPGFFETVGLLVERKLAQQDDVLELYGGALIRLHEVVGKHIEAQAEEMGMPSGYFEYFLALVERALGRA